MKIQVTRDYSKFDFLEINRDVKRTKDLERSMKAHGWIAAYPLHVVQAGNRLKIKAGHHRFVVARKLGIPVKYVVCSNDVSIHELEKATIPWSLKDYLTSYVSAGYPAYIATQEFVDRTGLPLSSVISMLAGECAGSFNKSDSFKNGDYEITTTEHAETVAEVLITMVKAGIKWAPQSLMVRAISQIVASGHADIKHLKKKIKTFPELIEKQPTLERFLTMLEDIYNHQSRSKIPLAFLTTETSKNRNPTVKWRKPANEVVFPSQPLA